jgi:hypothetical protein
LVNKARSYLFISSPYVGRQGAEFVAENLTDSFRQNGQLFFLTDLSPMNVCESATDPDALMLLGDRLARMSLFHLPRLHAKVYIADTAVAIVSSANLSAGGLSINYEYGVELSDEPTVYDVRRDTAALLDLGAPISKDRLAAYSTVAKQLAESFQQYRRETATAKREFERLLRVAQDDLIRLRLAGGPVHTVFARTILYLLNAHGPLSTEQMHPLIQSLHPDLCDDTEDRVIDGKRFGKKWKHAVRSAQQNLKKTGSILLDGQHWRLTNGRGIG